MVKILNQFVKDQVSKLRKTNLMPLELYNQLKFCNPIYLETWRAVSTLNYNTSFYK